MANLLSLDQVKYRIIQFSVHFLLAGVNIALACLITDLIGLRSLSESPVMFTCYCC